jgi:hypothetical protein
VTPIGAILRGIVAGAAGVVAMDVFWYVRYRRGGGRSGPLGYEFGAEKDWTKVSAPGKLGKRLIEGFTQDELPAERAPLVNNAMHWAYGLGWGAIYGVVAGSLRDPRPLIGPAFGAVVWVAGYALLPLAKLYKPIWEYDAKTLGQDLAGHLLFGVGTGVAFRLLTGNGSSRRAR